MGCGAGHLCQQQSQVEYFALSWIHMIHTADRMIIPAPGVGLSGSVVKGICAGNVMVEFGAGSEILTIQLKEGL